jgi:hypothetical protein
VFVFLDPESWLFDNGRGLYYVLGAIGAVLLAIGGILLIARSDSWGLVLAGGAAVSLLQLLVYFRPDQFIGIAIDIAILGVVASSYLR